MCAGHRGLPAGTATQRHNVPSHVVLGSFAHGPRVTDAHSVCSLLELGEGVYLGARHFRGVTDWAIGRDAPRRGGRGHLLRPSPRYEGRLTKGGQRDVDRRDEALSTQKVNAVTGLRDTAASDRKFNVRAGYSRSPATGDGFSVCMQRETRYVYWQDAAQRPALVICDPTLCVVRVDGINDAIWLQHFALRACIFWRATGGVGAEGKTRTSASVGVTKYSLPMRPQASISEPPLPICR